MKSLPSKPSQSKPMASWPLLGGHGGLFAPSLSAANLHLSAKFPPCLQIYFLDSTGSSLSVVVWSYIVWILDISHCCFVDFLSSCSMDGNSWRKFSWVLTNTGKSTFSFVSESPKLKCSSLVSFQTFLPERKDFVTCASRELLFKTDCVAALADWKWEYCEPCRTN